ncbi:MAG: BON domain-containing protein [Proteobacteria bacterium]|nr:BON domain-containing protein [Pseudomonadota bacterium]
MNTSVKWVAVTTIALFASGCSVFKGQKTAGQFVDDSTIATRAKAALVKDSTVSATDFSVNVYKGEVTLTGVAKSESEVSRAIDDIKRVDGVKSVKNATRLASAN